MTPADRRKIPLSARSLALVEEALSGLRVRGLDVREWRMLSESNRLIALLEPCAWVAKIVPRVAGDGLARELAVAKHCADLGAPVVRPAPDAGPHWSSSTAATLWHRADSLGTPSDDEARDAYASLRRSLDSFSGSLPDFREAILHARQKLHATNCSAVSEGTAQFLDSLIASGLAELEKFAWRSRALHGDAHIGNLLLTSAGALWLDFEAACVGPIEWDLTSLPEDCQSKFEHDPQLFRLLERIRRACVVTWCALKAEPSAEDTLAIERHLEALHSDSPKLCVRAVGPRELALVRDLRLAALRDAPDQLGESWADAAARSDGDWATLIASVTPPSTHAAYVAELGAEPAGMVYALTDQKDQSIGRLGGMWVAPFARRRGVGAALVEAVIAWCRASGKRCVQLGVVPGGAPERLYRRSGFIVTGASKPFPGSESRRVIEMQLELELRG
jgi:GNAT superfamily N-acetyltransferase